MTFFDFAASYWWLAFPVIGMISWVIRAALRDDHERQRLRIIKSYADQGKDIPEALRRELYR